MANEIDVVVRATEQNVTSTLDGVGDSATRMGDRVSDGFRRSNQSSEEAASGLDRFGEAADGGEAKAQGFSDTLTGTADVMAGTAAIAKGDLFEGFTTLGGGLADLSGGIASFLVPALQGLSLAAVKAKISAAALAVQSGITSAATKLWAGAQAALNFVMALNPVTLIIIAIIALVAIIVVIATKTDWFSKLWHAIWGKIGGPVKAVFDFIVSYYKFVFKIFETVIRTWWKFFTTMWRTAIDFAVRYFKFILDIPGKLKNAFSRVKDFIYAPFRAAFNSIARAWNSTVGRLSFSVPGWVPGLGGKGFSVPNIPMLQRGGEVIRTGLALVHRGETVAPASTRHLTGGSGGDLIVSAAPGSERAFLEWLITKLAFMVRTEGQGSASYLSIKVT